MKPSFCYAVPPALAILFLTTLLSVTPAAATTLSNGLQIETTKPIACTRKTQNGDRLQMKYKGVLQTDGSQFDSNFERNSPFVFTLGGGQVIKGWDQGLVDMCIGEARRLTIPPQLGYGSRDMGKIPPNSVLVFDVELLGIEGVKKEASPEPATQPAKPATEPDHIHTPGELNTKPGAVVQVGSKDGPGEGAHNNGKCQLLGDFAILVQGALGLLALLALVVKRLREKPRRPVLIWFFDVSKQVVGSFMLHFANLFLAMLSSGSFELNSAVVVNTSNPSERSQPNPCSFYLLNLAIDTTIGIPILVFFLRVFHALFLRTPLGNPPESLKSGNYGQPPNWRWWGKQALVYFLGLFGMKFIVFLIFQIFPGLGWIGDWALRWTEGKEWVQITFVMFIFPLIMNAAQYWIIDSFIKDTTADHVYEPVAGSRRGAGRDSDDEDENEGLMGQRRDSDEVSRGVARRSSAGSRTKSANPLPLPIEFESDDEGDRR